MTYPIDIQDRRRSQRILHSVPLFVRCLDPPFEFVGHLYAVEVSSYGCVIHAPRPFPHGTRLRLDIPDGHCTTTARVIHSDPLGTGRHLSKWTVALELEQPGNVWMVNPPASGWSKITEQQRNRGNLHSSFARDTDQTSRW